MNKVKNQQNELIAWKIVTTKAQISKRKKMIERLKFNVIQDEQKLNKLINQY